MNLDKITSKNSLTDDKNIVVEPTTLEQPETTSKCHLSRKTLWNSSQEKETFRNAVLYYPFNHKRRNTGAKPKRRENWTGMIPANNIREKTNTEMEKDIVYNIRDLYQMSNDQLETYESNTSSINCKFSNCRTSICRQNSKCGTCQNIKVETVNMLLKQEVEIKDQAKTQVDKSDIKCCKRCSLEGIKSDINYPRNRIEVEIFKIPPLQKVLTIENKTPKITELLRQYPETIENSNEDTIRKTEIGPLQADIVKKVVQQFTEFGQYICKFLINSIKSTNKSDSLLDTCTQTVEGAEIKETNSASKLSKNCPTTSTFNKRKLELHRLRIQVEQKRLELLDLKLLGKRQEIEQEKILFEKRLQMKTFDFNQVNEETDV